MQYLPTYLLPTFLPTCLPTTLISLSQDCPSQNRTVHPVSIVHSSSSSPCRRLLPAAPAAFLSLGDGSLPSPLELSILLSFGASLLSRYRCLCGLGCLHFSNCEKKPKRTGDGRLFVFFVFCFFGGVGGVTALL